jgi:hypothetical protein
MDEELIDYLFETSRKEGFKKNREDFVKYLQSDDELFDYLYGKAQKEGYKKDKSHFAGLVGRTATAAPVATIEPVKTEQTTIEPAKTEPTKTEPTTPIATPPVATETVATTEPATTTPIAETKLTVTPEPEKQVATPTVDMAKMPTMEVRSVEATPTKEEPMTAEKQEVVKSDIESQLLPVTEKTEVKAIETPSDKMVIKSEAKVEQPKVEPAKVEVKPTEVAKVEVKEMKTEQPKMKVKGKLKPEPIKIETIKVESEKGPTTVEVPSFAVPEPRKKYKPYGEKGPDVYYSEDYDQYIIKDGDNRTVVEKGSGKYEEIENNINNITRKIKESIEDCPESKGGCPKNLRAVSTYFANKYYLGQENEFGDKFDEKINKAKIIDDEGALANFIDKAYDGRSVKWIENEDYYDNNRYGGYYYTAEEPPKSKRFSVYKPYGNENTSIIFDNNTEAILKETDDKILSEDKKPLTTWVKISPDESEYKELKSIIEGINYKKEKGVKNTYVAPTISTGIPTTEWSQVKEVPAVSDKMVIKSEAKVEPKPVEEVKMEVKPVEEVKGIPSYDDLGINTEKDPGAFLDATFDKNTKFEKMSPSELIEKDVLTRRGSRIKLERNKSLRYPDPPGTVFQKEKVGERELYSSYDETNNKWYIYDENSSKDNWTEVKKGPIETLLFSKFFEGGNAYLNEKGRPIQSKEDYNSEEETQKMRKIREGILLNKYLPYVMKNYDNLSNEQKEKLKKDLGVYDDLLPKYIKYSDPNLDFWMNVNNKLFNNPTTTKQGEIEGGLSELYATDEGNVQYIKSKYDDVIIDSSKLNSDIKGGDIKVLKSFAGDVLYDEKKDIFYYDTNKKDINESKESLRLKIIPKGTFIYDKIKSSLSKYNK